MAEKEVVNQTVEAVIDKTAEPDFAKYADEANSREIAEKLGRKEPAKAAAEVVEPKKAEPKVEKEPAKPGESLHRLTPGQLRARLRELEAENRGLKAGRQVEEVVEEVVEEAPAAKTELRARPKPDDKNEKGEAKYKTWEDYEDDKAAWDKEVILKELDDRNTKKAEETSIAAVNKAIEQDWKERVTAASEKYDDFADAIDPELGVAKLIAPGSVVDSWILRSELGAELMYFFHHNRAELKKFENIEGKNPAARLRAAEKMLMAIEAKLAPVEGSEERDVTPEKPKPAAEREPRISRTPPPLRETGGRASLPVDRARAAVANDDVGSYMDEMNRRDIAARFGR